MAVIHDLDQSSLVAATGEVLDSAALDLLDRLIDRHGGPSRALVTKMRDHSLPIFAHRRHESGDRGRLQSACSAKRVAEPR